VARWATGRTDSKLDLKLTTPKELVGRCEGANPEQLFAAATAPASGCDEIRCRADKIAYRRCLDRGQRGYRRDSERFGSS